MTTATKPQVLSASSLTGDAVVNSAGEHLGKIEDLMIDLDRGRIAYAVLSFGGFLGIGDKLFAVPFEAMTVDPDGHCLKLDVAKEKLEDAPGFDKDNWPMSSDIQFLNDVYSYYGTPRYW